MFFLNSRLKLLKWPSRSLIIIINMAFTTFIISLQKKKKKMRFVRFLPKAVIVCSGKEVEINCKNHYSNCKLAHFEWDTIS